MAAVALPLPAQDLPARLTRARLRLAAGLLLVLPGLAVPAAAQGADPVVPPAAPGGVPPATEDWPGETRDWEGHPRHDFHLSEADPDDPTAGPGGQPREDGTGVACSVIEPTVALPGKPWVWRAQHFLHRPEVDRVLLDAGYHLAWTDTADLYGAPRAVARMDAFARYLRERHGLGEAALLGYDDGALAALGYALAHPRGVRCVVLDNPVCDLRSWPAGLGRGEPDGPALERCAAAWGVTVETLSGFEFMGSPLDRSRELADAHVPLLVGYGTEDAVVPPAENAERLVKHLRDLGGAARLMPRHGSGHHPLGPDDPQAVAQWVHRWTVDRPAFVTAGAPLARTAAALSGGRTEADPVRVGFLGGSLTEAAGWNVLLRRRLSLTYPGVPFEFVLAGRASVDSTGDAFRVEEDLLGGGPLDLVLLDTAVNDRTNGRSATEVRRGLEGVVRRLRVEAPGTDVVLVVLPDEDKLAAHGRGRSTYEVDAARAVARHHGLWVADVAAEVAFRIRQGELDWLEDFGGVHPKAYGYRVYERAVAAALMGALERVPAGAAPADAVREPLDPHSYDAGRMWTPAQALDLEGADAGDFTLVERWSPMDGAGVREGFTGVPALVADTPGATCRLPFQGRAVGVLVTAGPDAGTLEWRVDDGPWRARSLFTRWSAGLHLPWWHVLESELDPTEPHVLELRVGAPRDPASTGHAVRVLRLLVNG